MTDVSRARIPRLRRPSWTGPSVVARARLFGLLALLVPTFAGLQYVAREGMPSVEIRFVSRDVPVEVGVPVEVPVERVVERVVYVPVPLSETAPLAPEPPAPLTSPTLQAVPGLDVVSGTPLPSDF